MFKSGIWLLVDNFVKIVVGVLVTAYVIRYLGPENYGVLAFCILIMGFLHPIITLGTDAILFRDLIKSAKGQDKIQLLQVAILLRLFIGLFILMIVVFLMLLSSIQHKHLYFILYLGLVAESLWVFKEYYLSKEFGKNLAISSILGNLTLGCLNFIFIHFEYGILAFGVAIFFQKVSVLLMMLTKLDFNFRLLYKFVDFNFYIYRVKTLIKDSWPLIFTTLLGVALVNSDQLVVKYLLGYSDLGLYNASIKLVLVMSFLPGILSNTVYPRITSFHGVDRKRFEDFVVKVYASFIFVSFIISVTFYFSAETLINVLYGSEFSNAVFVLQIYSFTLFFTFLYPLNNKLLVLENNQKMLITRNLFCLAFNIVGAYLLVNTYGIIGAAISAVLTSIVMCFIYFFNKKTRYILKLQWLGIKVIVTYFFKPFNIKL